jgi:hypothetical protein
VKTESPLMEMSRRHQLVEHVLPATRAQSPTEFRKPIHPSQ